MNLRSTLLLSIRRLAVKGRSACISLQSSSVMTPCRYESEKRSFSSPSTEGSSSSQAFSTTRREKKVQVAVVGSGPSGCFLATTLTKQNPLIHVDIFERLPTPFGLCRYGVSPDHPDVKNVEKQFLSLFKSGRVTWMGNIEIGRDIPLSVLLEHYAAVAFATGADQAITLQIRGRDLNGVVGAGDVVSYYNTVPSPIASPRISPFPLNRVSKVAIIGNGNVAIDVTRFLAMSYQHYASTDMNCFAIRELMQNQIRFIDVVGRKGVNASAFSTAAFRELTQLESDRVKVEVDPFNLEKMVELLPSPGTKERAHRRLMEFLHKFSPSPEEHCSMQKESKLGVKASSSTLFSFSSEAREEEPLIDKAMSVLEKCDHACSLCCDSLPPHTPLPRGPCAVRFRYNLAPVCFLPQPKNKNQLGGILFRVNSLSAGEQGEEAENFAVLPCDVAIQSIGYFSDMRSLAHSNSSHGVDVPVDAVTGRIIHERGRVKGLPRVYCCGWAKNGAKGVILHSLADAQETARSILEDMKSKVVPCEAAASDPALELSTSNVGTHLHTTMQGKFGLIDYFLAKKLEPVSVGGLERIFYVESQRGIDLGKKLEKMNSIRDMLDVALGEEVGKKSSEEFRGLTPARAKPLMYLKELLDDDTDLTAFAYSLAKDMPHRLAEKHPNGSLSPSQL